eukprot:TRINITY_DN1663_c0_g1_i4.p1 TRINITY_DN1663_c0_g1~~TRINITY_DN1663_c0_g1_i4.p1  ORF type:complete len:890 (-),score=231.02 TRINITY_DN1663_c0_g1_i4:93-2762(-)
MSARRSAESAMPSTDSFQEEVLATAPQDDSTRTIATTSPGTASSEIAVAEDNTTNSMPDTEATTVSAPLEAERSDDVQIVSVKPGRRPRVKKPEDVSRTAQPTYTPLGEQGLLVVKKEPSDEQRPCEDTQKHNPAVGAAARIAAVEETSTVSSSDPKGQALRKANVPKSAQTEAEDAQSEDVKSELSDDDMKEEDEESRDVKSELSEDVKEEDDEDDTEVKDELTDDDAKEEKPEEVKAEEKVKEEKGIKQEVKAEEKVKEEKGIKQEVKAEEKVKEEKGIKQEVKDEEKVKEEKGIKSEMKSEAKDEGDQNIKHEMKEEDTPDGVKRRRIKVKTEPQDVTPPADCRRRIHVKSEPKDDMTPAAKRQRIRVKTEPKDDTQPASKRRRISVKSEPKDPLLCDTADSETSALPPKQREFRRKLHGWIKQCIDFQRAKRTWTPARPCCPANCFKSNVGPPPKPRRGQKLKSCFHRLTPCEQRKLKLFWEHNQDHECFKTTHKSEELGPVVPRSRPVVESSLDGVQHRGAEMMKMWPWMRDLPSRLWAGRGWVHNENGCRKLESAGGCDAIPGVEFWEGKGKAVAEDADVGADPAASSSISSSKEAAEGAEAAGHILGGRGRLSKQSGISGIFWKTTMACWCLEYRNQKEGGKRKQLHFQVAKFKKPGSSEDEADKAALQAAVAKRKELVKTGAIKETKTTMKTKGNTAPMTDRPRSAVPGVYWHPNEKKWRVQVNAKGGKKKQGGGFKPENATPEAMERAKRAAEAKAKQMHQELGNSWTPQDEIKQVKSASELVKRKSGYTGVHWAPSWEAWRAKIQINGKDFEFTSRPSDDTPEEVQRAFLAAVEWRKEKENVKAGMTKETANGHQKGKGNQQQPNEDVKAKGGKKRATK